MEALGDEDARWNAPNVTDEALHHWRRTAEVNPRIHVSIGNDFRQAPWRKRADEEVHASERERLQLLTNRLRHRRLRPSRMYEDDVTKTTTRREIAGDTEDRRDSAPAAHEQQFSCEALRNHEVAGGATEAKHVADTRLRVEVGRQDPVTRLPNAADGDLEGAPSMRRRRGDRVAALGPHAVDDRRHRDELPRPVPGPVAVRSEHKCSKILRFLADGDDPRADFRDRPEAVHLLEPRVDERRERSETVRNGRRGHLRLLGEKPTGT